MASPISGEIDMVFQEGACLLGHPRNRLLASTELGQQMHNEICY